MRGTVTAVLLAITLAGCGGGEPDVAGCEKAMRAQYKEAQQSGAQGKRPAECQGVPDAELERIVGKILAEQ